MSEVNRNNGGEENNIIPFISKDILRSGIDFLEDKNNDLSPENRTEKELHLAKILQNIYDYSIENQDGVIYVIREVRQGTKNLIEKSPILLKVKRILGYYDLAS